MPALDGAIKSLMQGVSQQVPRERLDGQVSLQTNMLSDLVDGMRRRPGMRLRKTDLFVGVFNLNQVFASSVDVEDASVHVLVNTQAGNLSVWNEDFSVLLHNSFQPYLFANTASSIQVATSRGQLFICNTSVMPLKVTDNTGRQNPATTGFFYVRAGQFSKTYTIILNTGGVANIASFTTPDGTNPGDAALATPEHIADQLENQIIAFAIPGVTVSRSGAYVFIQSITSTPVAVSSDAGTVFMQTSNSNRVPLATDLPARLPAAADGALCSTGSSDRTAVWYQFDFETQTWNEAAAYNSATGLTNMPLRLSLDGLYTLSGANYEGRLAGSDTTNEDPAFLTTGITGIGAFQGRLVLLAGPNVVLSASGKPTRFYRSTVVDLLVVDPISVFSGAATSTDFTHCVQFNKDLLLFSKSCQAVIPAGNAALTPTTAQIVITSSFTTTALVTPIVAGRSLLYHAPRSDTHAAALELVPSTSTDSQYTTNDISAHIPRYIPGVIRQSSASPTSNYVAMVATGDERKMFVQQYLWGDDRKLQSAWHDWSSPADIACTWFVRDTVYIGLHIGNALFVVSVEPNAGGFFGAGIKRPFSDLYQTVSVVDRQFILPMHLRTTYQEDIPLMVCYGTGSLAGELAGIESVNESTWVVTLVRNTPNGTYTVGNRFESVFSPTPPTVRDAEGIVIGTSAAILVRYEVTMQNSGAFNVQVLRNSTELENGEYSGLLYSSEDLDPGTPLVSAQSKVLIPIRALANETSTIFSTDDDHDMGILTIEYVMQYHARRRRV